MVRVDHRRDAQEHKDDCLTDGRQHLHEVLDGRTRLGRHIRLDKLPHHHTAECTPGGGRTNHWVSVQRTISVAVSVIVNDDCKFSVKFTLMSLKRVFIVQLMIASKNSPLASISLG